MKFIRRWVAIALLWIFVLGAASPLSAPTIPEIVRSVGCAAPIHVSEYVPAARSFYAPTDFHDIFGGVHERGLYLGTNPETDPNITLIIVLHETAHCLQHQAMGTALMSALYRFSPKTLELDADRQAVDMACRMGLDGPGMLRKALEYFHAEYGYNGDIHHGSLLTRESMASSAPACHPANIQAPWAL